MKLYCPFCGSDKAKAQDKPLPWMSRPIQDKYLYCDECGLISTRHVVKKRDEKKEN